MLAAALVLVLGAAPAKPKPKPPAPSPVSTEPGATRGCASDAATDAYRRGFALQTDLKADGALAAFDECLAAEPDCVPCLYESGWTHWSRSEWTETVNAWERVMVLTSGQAPTPGSIAGDVRAWIRQARENAAHGGPGGVGVSIPIGTASTAGSVGFALAARFQNYDAHPKSDADHYDSDVDSPKSVRFSADGKKVWVNSLAGAKTIAFDAATLATLDVIDHRFDDSTARLFAGKSGTFPWKFRTKAPDGKKDTFRGFPVEGTLTHGGRYLWIPYYRRDWDAKATSPSAIAIVDAASDRILRVMPAGPIPKYVVASPDGKWLAVVHWGDNTVGLIDIAGDDPAKFHYVAKMVVEQELALDTLGAESRDKACGFCLRGSVFTPDSKTLLVARMGGGGIAGFDVATHRYLGTVLGMKPTPRHLALSPDGATLYVSSNVAGYVSRIPLAEVVSALQGAKGTKVTLEDFRDVYVGGGARTLALSPDGKTIYVATQMNAELVAVDAATMQVVGRIRADCYPVGLAVAPDGKRVWVTCQGRQGRGGNSVLVYDVRALAGAPIPIAAPSPGAATGSVEE